MAGQDQRFAFSRGRDAVREYGEKCGLGLAEATGGRYHAQVIRASAPSEEGTGPHRHALDFQMVYLLKGWARFDYEGEGEITLKPGDCVLQPPGIRHELTACSEDMELLEVTSPADFGTEPA